VPEHMLQSVPTGTPVSADSQHAAAASSGAASASGGRALLGGRRRSCGSAHAMVGANHLRPRAVHPQRHRSLQEGGVPEIPASAHPGKGAGGFFLGVSMRAGGAVIAPPQPGSEHCTARRLKTRGGLKTASCLSRFVIKREVKAGRNGERGGEATVERDSSIPLCLGRQCAGAVLQGGARRQDATGRRPGGRLRLRDGGAKLRQASWGGALPCTVEERQASV